VRHSLLGWLRLQRHYWLLAALLVGVIARLPGVYWSSDFPLGWQTHHPDEWTHLVKAESMIDPRKPPRWDHPYPKGMAAHAAVPILVVRAIQGKLFDKIPTEKVIIITGRVVSVLYGIATILLVFLWTQRLFRAPRTKYLAAWIIALGGLHVSQSHFFVADVPGIFWLFLGLYLLCLDLDSSDKKTSLYLHAAAFSMGVAFGMKLLIMGLPSVAIMAVSYRPRVLRVLYTMVFFVMGVFTVNAGFYTPADLAKTFSRGISGPQEFSRLWSAMLYVIEMPSVVSFPIFLLGLGGVWCLGRKLLQSEAGSQRWRISILVLLPSAVSAAVVGLKLDHFARHLLVFVPWIAMVSAWSLGRIIDRFDSRQMLNRFALLAIVAYLGVFVYDGERFFRDEARNRAAQWILDNVPPGTTVSWEWHAPTVERRYKHVYFPYEGRPAIIVMQMQDANHYLSGMGFRDSYPKEYRHVYSAMSQEGVEAVQGLFRGSLDYIEVARFGNEYFMPEYVLADGLLGNRSRNYLTEIVIFQKREFPAGSAGESEAGRSPSNSGRGGGSWRVGALALTKSLIWG
jgi:hypothetical protein